jgi:hypothetical protein
MANDNSPYFLRLELLKLAKDTLSDEQWTKNNKMQQDYEMEKNIAGASYVDGQPRTKIPFPETTHFTVDDVIERARKLNEFMSNG